MRFNFDISKESLGSVEKKVKLSEEACCALDRGFEQNPALIKQLGEIVGEDKVRALSVIPLNTEEMFTLSENMKTVYGQVAKRELERIEAEREGDEDLVCGHSVAEHQEALQSVVKEMEPTIH